jgi:glycosyltransferase involved in cell wall biosynthesis
VVVADDGSTDDCRDVVTAHADTAPIPITYVRQPHCGNRWARARNLGIQLGRGRILLMLDGDTIPSSEVLRIHVDEQRSAPALLAGARLWRHQATDLADTHTPAEQLRRLHELDQSRDPHCRRREHHETQLRSIALESAMPWRAWFGCHASMPALPDALYDEAMAGWGPVDIELGCRLQQQTALPVRYLPHAQAWQVERDTAVHNPFRTGDPIATADYVRQICRMIIRYPDLPLADTIPIGFDRLVLADDDTWRTVPRGDGADPSQTLSRALDWYQRTKPLGEVDDR